MSQQILDRPSGYRHVVAKSDNDLVYVGYTHIDETWMLGLFANRTINEGEYIAPYTGRVYTIEDSKLVDNQAYMFTAQWLPDRRCRRVIDGNPHLYPNNIAGYANFAQGESANAQFIQVGARDATDPGCPQVNVAIIARRQIPEGVEIRVDYDIGSPANPFFDQMRSQGISARALKSPTYMTQVWIHPETPMAQIIGIDVPGDQHLPRATTVAPVEILPTGNPDWRFPDWRAHAFSGRGGGRGRGSASVMPGQSRDVPAGVRKRRPRGRPPRDHMWDEEYGMYVRI